MVNISGTLMFRHRSTKSELMDDLTLDSDELRKNLDELELYNKWLGGKKVLISSLDKIYRKYLSCFTNQKTIIADLGCGSGDLTRAIDNWAKSKNMLADVIGIDANPCMTQYARDKSKMHSSINYQTLNIFSAEFSRLAFDIVCLNSVSHHFSDKALVDLLQQLARQTRLAIIINDLQRNWLSYYAIKAITGIFPVSSLAKHDAPLSVLKAFHKNDLINLFQQSNLKAYSIRWAWAFRWDIIIWLL